VKGSFVYAPRELRVADQEVHEHCEEGDDTYSEDEKSDRDQKLNQSVARTILHMSIQVEGLAARKTSCEISLRLSLLTSEDFLLATPLVLAGYEITLK
jgi:hypothetical protein